MNVNKKLKSSFVEFSCYCMNMNFLKFVGNLIGTGKERKVLTDISSTVSTDCPSLTPLFSLLNTSANISTAYPCIT